MRMRCLMVLITLGVLGGGPVHAQVGATKPADTRSVGQEALALFERVCIDALVRRIPAEQVAAAALTGSARVPAERLRTNGPVRETAGWQVQGRAGRHTVMMLEPGSQCAIYTEGVEPDGFLAAVQTLMLRADLLPGWTRQGEPTRSSSPRPFGTLTYLRARYVSLPPSGSMAPPSGVAALPTATILASAANRTDGRPNTAVLTTDIEGSGR